MKRIFPVVVLSLAVLAGIAYGAQRFYAGRSEKRTFEAKRETPVTESVSTPVAEGESMDDVGWSEPVESADEPEGRTVVPTESDPVGSGSEARPVSATGIADRLVPFGHEDRPSRSVDTVIVHSSYDALGDEPYSVPGIIEEYRQYGVAAHYLIDREGKTYRLVEDRDVAYHAGVSVMPDGRTGVNEFSIGIELVEKDTDSPTEAQYASLNDLLAHLRGKYAIRHVLGHDDIAPGRKTDPWNFDWNEIE